MWATPDEALKRFTREGPYLKEGKTPPPEHISEHGCTLRELVNDDFLDGKQEKLKAGELSPLSFVDYFRTCEGLIDHFGKDRRVDDLRPDDFRSYRAKLAGRCGVVRLKGEINRVRIVLKYAFDSELIEKPVRFGQDFDQPSAKQLRRHKNQSGPKLFSRKEIFRLIEAADVHLRAMIYLGINCAFGPTDCATLPLSVVETTARQEGELLRFRDASKQPPRPSLYHPKLRRGTVTSYTCHTTPATHGNPLTAQLTVNNQSIAVSSFDLSNPETRERLAQQTEIATTITVHAWDQIAPQVELAEQLLLLLGHRSVQYMVGPQPHPDPLSATLAIRISREYPAHADQLLRVALSAGGLVA